MTNSRFLRHALTLSLIAVAFESILAGDRWLQWRGPDGQGHSNSTEIPISFSMEDGVVWKAEIPGKGWSTPAVDEGRIWLTTATATPASEADIERRLADDPLKGMKEVVAAVQLRAIYLQFDNGRVEHDILLAEIAEPDPINPLNNYASPSPVIDGEHVYLHFGALGTWCLDSRTGEKIWDRAIKVNHSVGAGSSPLISGDLLVLVCDGTDHQFVAALDKNTGEEVWRTSRPPIDADNGEFRKAYSTPVEIDFEGQKQLVVPGAQWICSYDSTSGSELWRVDHGKGFSVSPMPVVTQDGLVIFSTGYMRPELVAVRLGGEGDVTETHIAWRSKKGAPAKPSPILAAGGLYMVSDLGVLTKIDTKTGDVIWNHRLGGNYSASPVQVGDKLIFCSHEGNVTIVKAGETYEELAKNELEPRLMASPVVINDQLLIRTEFSLLRVSN